MMNDYVTWRVAVPRFIRMLYAVTIGILLLQSCGKPKNSNNDNRTSSSADAASNSMQQQLLNKLNLNLDDVALTQSSQEHPM